LLRANMNQRTFNTGASSALERVDQIQQKVGELRTLLARFRDAIDGQQVSLRRLSESRRDNNSEQEQEKAIRQMIASLMLFEGLGGQIDIAFNEFEQPLVNLMTDVSNQLRDREQLAALSKSAEALNSTLDLNAVLTQAMDMLVQLTGAERAFFMLKDPVTGRMKVRVAHNNRRRASGSLSIHDQPHHHWYGGETRQGDHHHQRRSRSAL
jgi:hypothetical protein